MTSEAKAPALRDEWSADGDCIWGGYLNKDTTHALIAQCFDNDKECGESCAQRTVACVNACAGIETAALESGVLGDLIEACAAYIAHHDDENESNEKMKRWLDREGIPAMRAALAKLASQGEVGG